MAGYNEEKIEEDNVNYKSAHLDVLEVMIQHLLDHWNATTNWDSSTIHLSWTCHPERTSFLWIVERDFLTTSGHLARWNDKTLILFNNFQQIC